MTVKLIMNGRNCSINERISLLQLKQMQRKNK